MVGIGSPNWQPQRGGSEGLWLWEPPSQIPWHNLIMVLGLGEEQGEQRRPVLQHRAAGKSFLCGSRLEAQPTSVQRSFSWLGYQCGKS